MFSFGYGPEIVTDSIGVKSFIVIGKTLTLLEFC